MQRIKIYIVLFIFSNLIARQSTLDQIGNFIFSEQLKIWENGKVAPDLENYIRSIASELKMTKDFEIKNMSQAAIQTFGATNAFALGTNLFVCPLFLESLTEAERRFLIGHELMHIEKSHSIKNYAGTVISFLAASFGIEYLIKKNKKSDFDKFLSYSAICALPIWAFFSSQARSRASEFEADRESAIRLNEVDGGVAFLTTLQKYYNKYNYSTYLSRIKSTHPSFEDRIEQLKSLKNIEGQNAK